MLIALGAADTIVGITETTKNVSYIIEKIPSAQSLGTGRHSVSSGCWH
jgi:ABC-type hemin transport system substrate-binding protein